MAHPQIDVSDVIVDPMISAETFTVTRRQETVGSNGQVSTTNATLSAAGAISPLGDNSLLREEAFQTQQQAIRVVTLFRLRGAGSDGTNKFQPDIVNWNSNKFLVRTVNDFTRYGAGFVEAECISIDYSERAPGTG